MEYISLPDLIASIDAYSVARYIGMDVISKGSYNFIHCPGHINRLGKQDTHASNCVLTAKGYHCFGCDKTVNMIDMVMEYLGVPFKDAIKIIAEAAGGAELFRSSGNYEFQPKLPLTAEELNAIGLLPSTNCSNFVDRVHVMPDEYDYAKDQYVIDGEDILKVDKSVPNLSLLELYKKHKEIYELTIINAAKKAITEYNKAIEDFASRSSLKVSTVYELFENDGGISSKTFSGIKTSLLKKKAIAEGILKKYQDAE